MEGFRDAGRSSSRPARGCSRHPAITRRTESGRSSATNSRVRGDPARPRPRRPGAGAPWPLALRSAAARHGVAGAPGAWPRSSSGRGFRHGRPGSGRPGPPPRRSSPSPTSTRSPPASSSVPPPGPATPVIADSEIGVEPRQGAVGHRVGHLRRRHGAMRCNQLRIHAQEALLGLVGVGHHAAEHVRRGACPLGEARPSDRRCRTPPPRPGAP